MPEPNPMAVIADCIEKAKATSDQELIGNYIAEALGAEVSEHTEFAVLLARISDGGQVQPAIIIDID